MNATERQIAATVRAAGELGEKECTVLINGTAVTVHVPDTLRFESPADPQRLAQLQVLQSKPIHVSRN